jgi:hypothetical protein
MDELPLIQPPQELLDILLPAFGPCPAMQGKCRDQTLWMPEKGYVPRGYRGATGKLDSVELVLVCAEPGDAFKGESYDGLTALEKLLTAYRWSYKHIEHIEDIEGKKDRFAQNLRKILDMAFPGLSLAEQLERTWITEAVLCSAPKECGRVIRQVEQECGNRYLVPQLNLFPNARIVALGRKAWRRLQALQETREVRQAYHPAHRRTQKDAEDSWRRAVEGLSQDKRGSKP